MTYKRRGYSGLYQGHTTNYFQNTTGVDIEVATVKTINHS
jgi:hypothetical protein